MSSPPPGWCACRPKRCVTATYDSFASFYAANSPLERRPDPHGDAGVDDTLALLPPDALWPPLPPPDLSRPPPWLLPPPAPGAPPPPPPPGGWASSWETAVEWPPPAAPPWATQDAQQAYAHAGFWPPPGGDAGAYDDGDDANAYEDEDDEPYEEEAYDEGAFAAAGEVIWRVGDTLDDEDDEDEDETPEVVLELSDEWAARFALTEHRRAQRKLQERAANRQGGQAPDAPPSNATPAAAPAGPPLTVVDIVRAAGTAASRPNEALYGAEGSVRVAALEAAVQARYTKAQSGGKAMLWPCEPLRSA